jgi:hypothetical protein
MPSTGRHAKGREEEWVGESGRTLSWPSVGRRGKWSVVVKLLSGARGSGAIYYSYCGADAKPATQAETWSETHRKGAKRCLWLLRGLPLTATTFR